MEIPDDDVLRFASSAGRAVVTLNRKDFKRLHRVSADHAGIVACSEHRTPEGLAASIDKRIRFAGPLQGAYIEVQRPADGTEAPGRKGGTDGPG